jgi:predicted lipoprotein with Yx(FWY)xxD motif
MKVALTRTAFGFAAALMLAACAATDEHVAGPALTRDTSLGTVLTDARGMTLYTLTGDESGKSTCYDRCARSWPPFLVANGVKPVGKWTIAARTDGTQQWAYNGKPLYLWDKDKQPGDVTGHKVGDVWWVARP